MNLVIPLEFLGVDAVWWGIIVMATGIVAVSARWGIKFVWDWYHQKKHDEKHQIFEERISRLEKLLEPFPLTIERDQPLQAPAELLQLEKDVGEEARTSGALNCGELIKLGNVAFWQSDYGKAAAYYRVAMDQADASNDTISRANALGNIGLIFQVKGQPDEALKCHNEALRIAREIAYRQGEASVLGNIGLIHKAKGELDEALNCHQSALAIHVDVGYRLGEANQLGNIGLIQKTKGNMDGALERFRESLVIHREVGNRWGEAVGLGNIGLVYQGKKAWDEALKYHNDALAIHREVGNRKGEASNLGNIGLIYRNKRSLDEALKYFTDALAINREIGYCEGVASQLGNIGAVCFYKGELDEALKYLRKGLEIFEQIGLPIKVEKTNRIITKIEAQQKDGNDHP